MFLLCFARCEGVCLICWYMAWKFGNGVFWNKLFEGGLEERLVTKDIAR